MAAAVLLGIGVTAVRQRADLAIAVASIEGDHRIDELRLPVPAGFVVSESRGKGLTEMEGGPASSYSITYKVSEPQADEPSALRVLPTLRAREAPAEASRWIAQSMAGVQNLRAIEVVAIAPESCRAQAEPLGSALASHIR